MLFNSYQFLLGFLPIALVGYFVLGRFCMPRIAVAWLCAASLFFYAWWNPKYLGLLLLSIVFNFFIGREIGRNEQRTRGERLLLIVGIVTNLALLGYFKYAGFFSRSILPALGINSEIGDVILPLGISFFTFTQIAYLVDAYHKEVRDYGFGRYLLFVTFFPHLIAGPVLHHAEIMPQFARPEVFRPSAENFAIGLSIFAIGLFKKVIIADGVAGYATPVFAAAAAGEHIGGVAAWSGALAYTFQIYFDFSGYSDMAIGLARLFGVTFPANFDSPYKASSIIDFWRRWHMTLSRFLRDYLYIPLGGSHCSQIQRHLNLLTTMLLGGLWHGAGETFVIWGGLHGFFLVANHVWRKYTVHFSSSSASVFRVGNFFAWILTFLSVVIAWVFFRAETLDAALNMLHSMGGEYGFAYKVEYFRGATEIKHLLVCVLIVLCLPNIQDFMHRYRAALDIYTDNRFGQRLELNLSSRYWAIFVGLIAACAVINISELSEFLYFQF